MVRVKLIGWLVDKAGFKEKEILLKGKKKRVIDLVPEAAMDSPDRIVVLVNHKGASLDTLVGDDDYVAIMPVVGGG